MKVLIVDDHDEFRTEIRNLLEHNGHEVSEASSADEGISVVNSHGFDVVLLDFSMPGHSGLWLMEHCTIPEGTRVLFVTAHISKPLFERMLRSGAAGYLVKPFDADELLEHPVFRLDT